MSDYLFDPRDEPNDDDVELQRLEGLLRPLAYRGAPPRLPARRPRRAFVVAAGLSALAAALVALVIARPWRGPRVGGATSWAVTLPDGDATIDGRPASGVARLPVGAWLSTEHGRARLVVADIGTVELAAETRVRIVATGAERHVLQLARGTLAAVIDAPPRRFVVATPSAIVTNLGCAFELAVDEAGRGHLAVTGGRVSVAAGALSPAAAREVVVDAGMRVELSERGPGVPSALDAPAPTPPTTPQTTLPQPLTPMAPLTTKPTLVPSKPAPLTTTKPHAKSTSLPMKPTLSPARQTTRAPSVPASANATTRKPPAAVAPSPRMPAAPSTKRTPTVRPADDNPHVEHDSLKALEHSVE